MLPSPLDAVLVASFDGALRYRLDSHTYIKRLERLVHNRLRLIGNRLCRASH